jgi:antitoxin-like ribbon-helix-helix protein
MARRPSLDTAAATPTAAPSPNQPPAAGLAHVAPRTRTSGRRGKRGVAFWLNPDAFRQLGMCSVEEDRTVQSIMEEALDLFFQSRGKHRLASNGKGPAHE